MANVFARLRAIFSSGQDSPAPPVSVSIEPPRRPARTSLPSIRLANARCPYCDQLQDPPPQRRKKCRDCGEVIYTSTDHETRVRTLITRAQHDDELSQAQADMKKELKAEIARARRAGDLNRLSQAYMNQASFQFTAGDRFFQSATKAVETRLRHLDEIGITAVKVSTANDERVCEYCAGLDGQKLPLATVLAEMPLPSRQCTDGKGKVNPHGGRCRCEYAAVIE